MIDNSLWVEGGPGPIRSDGQEPTIGEIKAHDNELRIQRRIDAAVAAETEACAKIAETTYAKDAFHFELGTAVAAAIRARQPKTEDNANG